MGTGKRTKEDKERFLSGTSLAVKVWYIIGGVFLLFTIMFSISALVLRERSIRDYEIRESETILNSMSGSITANIENYKDISRLVMLNKQVTAFLRAPAEEVGAGLKNDTIYGINDIFMVSDYVDSVFIFRSDNHYVTTGKGLYHIDYDLMEDETWHAHIKEREGGAAISLNGNGAVYRANGNQLLTIGRDIYDIYLQKPVGLLLVNISTGMLKSATESQKGSKVCIVSEDGTLLAGDKSVSEYFTSDMAIRYTMVHKSVRGNKNVRMISSIRVPDTPIIVMCASNASAQSIPVETTAVMLLLFVTFVVSISFAAVFISRNITHPIYTLSAEMEKTKEAGWLKKIDAEMPRNELSMLKESYNSIIDYLNDLFTRLIDKEKSVQKAEMRVLHEQIKPHFLYNSLETISFMALDAGAKDVHSALETLGSFYRNFLSKGNREIPLSREISIIKDYLALQKLRYGDIINDEYDISEDTLDIKIPKLILQPLVENSIYHGIRLTGEPGTIKITSYLEDDDIHIIVRDTGVGMSQDTIDELLGRSETPVEDQNASFGLKGTIERIKYYCDYKDVVRIRSEIGEFTEIELIIPTKLKEEERGNV
ncbi:MAG: histidine kinase [Lachnospiraceae bacterium]|nr:histidine kinase [Lachnospiraceae bacterium]